jgi:GAF domain-containing protein
MNLIQTISPLNPPAHIQAGGELQVNRERILQTLLLLVGVGVLIAYVVLIIGLFSKFDLGQFVLYTITSLILWAFVAYRYMPYTLRSSIVVAILFFITFYTFQADGLAGNGKLFLLTFNALTTVLLGWKTGLYALVFGQVCVGILSFLMVNVLIPLSPAAIAASSMVISAWSVTGGVLLVQATVVTVAFSMLIRGQEAAFKRAEKLTKDLNIEKNSLQTRVEQSTSALQSRMVQILTASDISKIIVSFKDPSSALPQIAEMIRARFNLYYVGVFILDQNNNAVLRTGTGEAGEKMLAARHFLPAGGTSMIGWSIANRQARVALDVGKEAVRFNNPALPDTRSEMAIPIMRDEVCLGALSIQSNQPDAFDEDDIRILQGIADSLAIALENASLYQQAQSTLDEVRVLNRTYLQKAWSELIEESGNFSYTFDNAEVHHSVQPNQIQIPLSLREQVIGHLTLETDNAALSKDQLEFIDAITTQTALALENARLLEETQQRAVQEQTLSQLTAEFSRSSTIDEILKSALRQLSRLPAVNDISVHLLSPEASTPQNFSSNGNGNGNGSHSGNGGERKQ